jgi:seryl-tRNA synthetase
MIGENLKALEVAEEKAQQREEEYKRQIKQLSEKFKSAEGRAEYGEKSVQKLNLRIDNIMFDLVSEKMKTQTVNDELDQTFELFMNQ